MARGFDQESLHDTSDQTIRRLEEDLYLARKTIIDLAPDQFHDLLDGRDHTIETEGDLSQWQRDLHAAVIAAAKPESRPFEIRAACPLCRSRGAFRLDGWKFPAGLEIHLEGGGRSRRCPVTEAAWQLIRARNSEKF